MMAPFPGTPAPIRPAALRTFALSLLLMGALAACGGDAGGGPYTWHEGDGYRWADLHTPRPADPGFDPVDPLEAGIPFVNTLSEETFLQNRHYVNGSGVALGDVDGDGWTDLYLARLEGPNALYRNLGGWRFEEITEAAGVAAPDRFSAGAVFEDVDGDGDVDLLVTAMGGPNALYVNDGTGRFTEATAEAGLSLWAGSTSLALADVDGDGDLDLYVGNYKKHTVRDLIPPHERTFEQSVVREGNAFRLRPPFDEHYVLRRQGNRLMRFEYGEADVFYRNEGGGRFTRVPFTEGAFRDADGRPLAAEPLDWALSVRFQDVNGDGAPDLYVCNDFESPDHFWLNRGDGTFQAVSPLAVRKTSLSTMSIDFADLDGDGGLDFFLADMLSPVHTRRLAQVGMAPPDLPRIGDLTTRPQVMQNTLFVRRRDGTYAEVANLAGVAATEWTWSSHFLDVDLDADPDLLLTNGHAYDAMDADTQMRNANLPPGPAWRRALLNFPALDLNNIAFRNAGGLAFEPVPAGWGLGETPDVTHGLAAADLDHDGDLDLVTNRLNAPPGLFRNRASAPRLLVRLRGLPPNTRGIGAQVTVEAAGLPLQRQEMISGGRYLSGGAAELMFATGSADSVRVRVRWRSGRERSLWAKPNRVYEIDEAAHTETEDVPPSGPAEPAADTTAFRFEDVSARLGHTHVETPFDDFGRQPLLPYRLSQFGPPVALADLDGDGDDDVLIGSGRGGSLAYYRNDGGGRFRRLTGGPLDAATDRDHTGVAVLEGAAPGGGALVFVAASNYEVRPEAPGTLPPSFVDVHAASATGLQPLDRLDAGTASADRLATGDFDGDGDADLVVAGRFVPGQYGAPAASRLFVNDAGRFAFDEARSRPFEDLGLATDVAAGDLDGDGDLDLLFATEWGSLRLFLNDGTGAFTDATEAWGLAAYTGRWQSLALADFDGDGRLDVAAGNLGWNGRHSRHHALTPDGRPASDAHPLRLYWGHFDLDGTMDLLEAHYEPALGGYAPDRGLDVVSRALPGIRRRIRSFRQYATATVDEVLGSAARNAGVREAATLASMVFLNRGGRFEGRVLPLRAQFSPLMGLAAGDVDGDGHTDLVASENLFALRLEDARFDAGRGLWLRGDGQGGFTPEDDSGLAAYGEGRGVALGDVDGDGVTDVLLGQNGAPTMLYRGVRGRRP